MHLLKRLPVQITTSIVAILVCVVISIFIVEFWEPFVIAGIIAVSISLYSYMQHYNVLHGKRLSWLQSEGFMIENVGRYSGCKGIYEGFFTRIYVNPESHFFERMGPDLCIMVYFHPMRRADGKRDMVLMRRIEADLLNEFNWFQCEFLTCHAIHMHQRTRFGLFTGRRKIRKRLDRVVQKITQYGLKPWPETNVEHWVREAPDLHGPDMEEFRENFTFRDSS